MIYQIQEVNINNHTFRLVTIIEINSTLVLLHLVPVSQEAYDIWVLEYIHDNFKCIIFKFVIQILFSLFHFYQLKF